MNIKDYGYEPKKEDNIKGTPARVTAVHKERYDIVCEHGELHARLKTGVYFNDCTEEFPTTGDFVTIEYNPDGDSIITSTLTRRTFFSRRDPTPGRGEQAVAANFDYVFIMQSLNHDFNEKRLERYVTLARQSAAEPVIILTKADLVESYEEQMNRALQLGAGTPVFAVSAITRFGLDSLSGYLKAGKTIVFLGSSGIGKSSLVNALAGEELMSVNTIREDDSKGRHTTTHRQLIMLKNGVLIIDTPGMRELGMWDVTEGLPDAFPDVAGLLGRCRFSDCRHKNESGCAVREAIDSGALSEARWESYLKLKNEAKYSDDKSSLRRSKQEWQKSIAKKSKSMKNSGKIHY